MTGTVINDFFISYSSSFEEAVLCIFLSEGMYKKKLSDFFNNLPEISQVFFSWFTNLHPFNSFYFNIWKVNIKKYIFFKI